MSDRSMAGLLALLPTAFSWGLAWSYVREGSIYSGKTGVTVTRADGPKRFWAGVVLTALPGCFTFGIFVLWLFS